MEIEPARISSYLFDKTKLIDWLFEKIQITNEFDNNTHHASEILSILLSENEQNQKDFGKQQGIQKILLTLA